MGVGMAIETLIETISKQAGISSNEVKRLVEEKQEELSGLVSEEGAAYIVGRELGVSLLKESSKKLKLKNVVSGLKSVDVAVKVMRIFEPREFVKDGKKGLVMNLLVADETGVARLSLWDKEIELVKSLGIKEDDTARITGGYVKEDNRGKIELRLGRGRIERIEEEIAAQRIEQRFGEMPAKRGTINDLRVGDSAEVRASIVQLFKRNPFFYVCSQCGSKVNENNSVFECKEHGKVEPDFQIVLSGVLDDGFGNIRAVFFRELGEKIFGMSAKELRELMMKKKDPLDIYEHFTNLGSEFIFRGIVKKNNFTENLEFIVNGIGEVDVKKEIEKLMKEKS